MIINNIELHSYGKFENKSIPFKKGLNIIYGENGKGKTTLATALKTFLYKKYSAENKYKKLYIPLNGRDGSFSVGFSLDGGEEFETSAILAKTAAKTVFKTVNTKTGAEGAGPDEEIGERFLKISEEMFDSVCYIKTPDDFEKITVNNSVVGESLSEREEPESDGTGIPEALAELDKELKAFSRKTSTGKIYPLEAELDEINRKITEAETIFEESERLKKETEKLEEELSAAFRQREFLKTEEEKHKTYGEYKKYLAYTSRARKEKELLDSLAEADREVFPFGAGEEEKIEKLVIFAKENIEKPKKTFWLSAAAAALFAASGAINLYFFIPAFAFLSALAVMLIIYKKKIKAYNEKAAAIDSAKKEAEAIFKKCGVGSYEEYYLKKKKSEENKIRAEGIRKEIASLREFEIEKCERVFSSEPERPLSDPERIADELQRIISEISGLSEKKAVLSERRKNLFNNFPEYEELISERDALKEQIKDLRYEYEITSAAYEAMLKTQLNYKESYLPLLRKETERILKSADIIELDKIYMDEGFRPEIKEKNENSIKSHEYLSSGISDSVYFAIRLAAYNIAFNKKEKPFLILDDPFIRIDDKKTAKWLKYLSGKHEGQIIFLTAGERIFQLILEKDTVYAL